MFREAAVRALIDGQLLFSEACGWLNLPSDDGYNCRVEKRRLPSNVVGDPGEAGTADRRADPDDARVESRRSRCEIEVIRVRGQDIQGVHHRGIITQDLEEMFSQ